MHSFVKGFILILNSFQLFFLKPLLLWCFSFCCLDSFLSIFYYVCFLGNLSFFSNVFFSVDALESLSSEFDVFEIFSLSLAAVKVSSWKLPNVDTSSSTNLAVSTLAYCCVLCPVSPFSKPFLMDSVAGESLHILLQISKKIATILSPPLCYLVSNTFLYLTRACFIFEAIRSRKNACWIWKHFIFCWGYIWNKCFTFFLLFFFSVLPNTLIRFTELEFSACFQ